MVTFLKKIRFPSKTCQLGRVDAAQELLQCNIRLDRKKSYALCANSLNTIIQKQGFELFDVKHHSRIPKHVNVDFLKNFD